jgi:hypothetical protein
MIFSDNQGSGGYALTSTVHVIPSDENARKQPKGGAKEEISILKKGRDLLLVCFEKERGILYKRA